MNYLSQEANWSTVFTVRESRRQRGTLKTAGSAARRA